MELSAFGYDSWFEERSASFLKPGYGMERVTAVDRGGFLVRNKDTETYAEITGKMRFAAESAADLPCVGDWVCVQRQAEGGPAVIRGVVPRRTFLRRKSPGKSVGFQMIAANIDVAFIVQSCSSDFNLERLDRYLVMAGEGGIEPWILLTKTDLVSPDALEQTIGLVRSSCVAARVVALSNTTCAGLSEFSALLAPRRTYCLIGSSGVGKTTLVNRLLGYDAFDTNDVSETGEGVHTTSRRQLLVLDSGAMLIDTPGMRELGLLGASDGVADAFTDIHDHLPNCRFADCSHAGEPGCAVMQAVENGNISDDRYQSYLKLKKENEYHDLSYADKRRKDRSFGRFVKSVKKSTKECNK